MRHARLILTPGALWCRAPPPCYTTLHAPCYMLVGAEGIPGGHGLASPPPLLPSKPGDRVRCPKASAQSVRWAPRGPREAGSARLPRLLAPENKGAAPRASPIGPKWSSERRSQSDGGAALGRARPASQSGARARPPAPGLAGPGSPEPKSPRVAVPVNLSLKVKGIYSRPLPPSPSESRGEGRAEGQSVLWGRRPPAPPAPPPPIPGLEAASGSPESPCSGLELSPLPLSPWGRGPGSCVGMGSRPGREPEGRVTAGGTGWRAAGLSP